MARPMRESWTKTEFSKSLSSRPSRNTQPEIFLRRALHSLGLRFRLHRRIGKRLTVDIILPRHRLAVFVDGCFWHGCPAHGHAVKSGPNLSGWVKKFASIKEREQRAEQALSEIGFRTVRLWECAIRSDPVQAARVVLAATEMH
jgi:DNA mismatch endonuclease, patch repair protein